MKYMLAGRELTRAIAQGLVVELQWSGRFTANVHLKFHPEATGDDDRFSAEVELVPEKEER